MPLSHKGDFELRTLKNEAKAPGTESLRHTGQVFTTELHYQAKWCYYPPQSRELLLWDHKESNLNRNLKGLGI